MRPIESAIAGILAIVGITVMGIILIEYTSSEWVEEPVEVVVEEDSKILGIRSDDFGDYSMVGYPMLAVDFAGDYAPMQVDVFGRVICAPAPDAVRVRPRFESNFP